MTTPQRVVAVKHRDVLPHASPSCPRCSGKGEYLKTLDRTRRDGKRKREKQAVRHRQKVFLCPCTVRNFQNLQKCVASANGQMFAVEPFTHVSAETLAELEASRALPISATIGADEIVGTTVLGGRVGDGAIEK